MAKGFSRRSRHALDQGTFHHLTIRRGRVPLELSAGPMRHSDHASDLRILLRNAAEHSAIVEIRFVVVRFGAKNIVVGLDLDLLSGDAKILESRPQKTDRRHAAVELMFSGNLRHDAIGGQEGERLDRHRRIVGRQGRELPSADTLAAWQHVEERAQALRAAGVEGSLDELRVRAFLELLQGRDSLEAEDSGPSVAAQVTITVL